MAQKRITDLDEALPLTGDELVEVSQLSDTVTITATTISAAASDNSFNDSADGFVTAGFAVGDRVNVAGFTGDTDNNLLVGIVTALTAGKMTIGGTDGDVIVDDAAGESVTITKWTSKRALASDMGAGGGGGGGSAWSIPLRPLQAEMPDFAYAQLNSRNMRPCVAFDTTTQETCFWHGVLPNDDAGNGIIVDLYVALASATSGTVGWDVAFERIDASGLDLDSDSFATAKTITAATVPGTSGQIIKQSVTFSNSEIDGLVAGELFRMRLRRDVANDTATGDAQIFMVNLRGA